MQKIKALFVSKKFLVFAIFLIFSILVILGHHFAWLYHDDYAYGSLSYAYDTQIIGHSFSPSELGEFLAGHYVNWGGRILYFAVNCILLGLGVHAWRIFQSIVIISIFICLYFILKHYFTKIAHWKLALLTVCSYGFISIMVARDGIFWATASALYLFPLLPFLGFVIMYNNLPQHHTSIFYKIILCLLIFISTFSYEQISVAALSFIALSLIYNWFITKKFPTFDFILFATDLAGFLILMLAPGNAIRMTHPTSAEFYAMPFLSRIVTGTNNVLSNFFSSSNTIFLFFLLASSIIAAVHNSRHPISSCKPIKCLNSIALFSNCIIFIFNTIFSVNGGYYSFITAISDNHLFHLLATFIVTIQCLLLIYSFCIALYQKKQYILAKFSLCALAALCVMVVAPYFPARAMLIFEFIFFPIIASFILSLESFKPYLNYAPFLYLSISLISLANVIYIIRGYQINNSANSYNHNLLVQTSEDIKNGNDISSIKLLKLPDSLFGSDQPYQENRSYILDWMKRYYALPQDLIVTYED